MAKKNRTTKFQTVGDLLDELAKYDRSKPLYASQYHERLTEAGTDLGGNEEVDITAVSDLETRVVIDISRW